MNRTISVYNDLYIYEVLLEGATIRTVRILTLSNATPEEVSFRSLPEHIKELILDKLNEEPDVENEL